MKGKNKPKRKAVSRKDVGEIFPVLATRDVVPLPGLVIPVYVSKEQSLSAVNAAMGMNGDVVLVLQTSSFDRRPSKNNLARIGGRARIIHSVRLSSGDLKVSFHVMSRVLITGYDGFTPFIKARVEEIETPQTLTLTSADEQLINEVKQRLMAIGQYDLALGENLASAQDIFDPGILADMIASTITIDTAEAQELLEELNPCRRLAKIQKLLNSQIDAFSIKERISRIAQSELDQDYHQELLRQQMKQIRVELGEEGEHESELSELRKRIAEAKLPTAIAEDVNRHLRRLQQLHPDTSEAALARTYLDWIAELPWSKRTPEKLQLDSAAKILDEDHYGLEKTKERILDFLGVRKLRPNARGPILLFVGPPGVGKTSLGRSIARALGRKFVRVSLGGVRDEAELRGHRRTYVGALPGRIIQGLKTAGSRNPVFMLDEIDKIGSDFRGDPASVLLEVLDPEQNKDFEDHYLNVPFDLSEAMFIGTANVTDTIPSALLDRMEVIELSGYTDEEKLQIARRYLIPREMEENGLLGREFTFNDQAILYLIHGYTKESGVRELGRAVNAVFRKLARFVAEEKKLPRSLTPKVITDILGPVRFLQERVAKSDQVGIVTGLAWTSTGGEILTVETSITKGKSQLSLTGQLGEVMRESAMAALTYVLSKATELGVDPNFYETSNVHIHVPHGAIPKDGPSAGIAIVTALVSVLTNRPVSRHVAMTGEVTLRGMVLPIGGLKEKALAALRAGITLVVIPKENERELVEFPAYLREKITFAPVENVSEVISLAFVPKGLTARRPAKTIHI